MNAARSQIGSVSKNLAFKALVCAVCLCLWASMAIAAENPQAVIQNGTDQVLKLLHGKPVDPLVRNEIRSIVDKYFDFQAIAKRALGPQWKQVPPAKQAAFTQEFSQLLFNTYLGKVEEYSYENISYRPKQVGPDRAVIESFVTVSQSSPVTIDYYMHLEGGNWKVYDVMSNGVDLVSNYREQFAEILTNNSFDYLLQMLRQKVAQS